jgi:diazepam-binding inhibitor (GABA receptor modulating acyl-CoA-binding protein)
MATREAFDLAVAESKQLTSRPDNNTLLLMYSLYKQATDGDVKGEEPGMFDFVAKAKYNAWEKLKGTAAEDAMQQYIDIVARLKK